MAEKNNGIRFTSLFRPTEVICRTEQTDRDVILLNLLRLLGYQRRLGDVDEAYRAVLNREKEMSTVVAPGIAMPHARLDALENMVVGIVTSQNGIIYDKNRLDELIKLIILTLVPKDAPGAYLQAISSLAKICQDPATADIVASLPTQEKVWSFFEQREVVLRDQLQELGNLETVKAQLREHDTLEKGHQ
jgi:PTS system nitrogen regulatory IIA component